MSNKVIDARIKQKRDTNSNWQSKNPTLLNGEIILVDMSDGELRAKIGDGTNKYSLLPFTDEPLRNLIDTVDDKVTEVRELVGDTPVSDQVTSAIEHINTALDGKSDVGHTHTVDSALSSTSTNPVQNKVLFNSIQLLIDGIGNEPVADQITSAIATKADIEHNHDDRYYTEAEIDAKLKNIGDADTLDGKHAADFALAADLNELQTQVGDTAVSEQITSAVATKADAAHNHNIADVSGLQSALDGKAAKSHGNHVVFSSTAPVMDGTASVGAAGYVARSDHRHPTDTSRAAQADLETLQEAVESKADTDHTHNYAGSSSAGGAATSAKKVENALTINVTGSSAVVYDGSAAKSLNLDLSSQSGTSIYYGTCSTASLTAEKAVECSDFSLAPGVMIAVLFKWETTATSITLNVNSTGAKPIYYNGEAVPQCFWQNGEICLFRYNGTQYEIFGSGARITSGKDIESTVGLRATAEGRETIASGEASHAEGYGTTASGKYSHAEGSSTIASGQNSHAEGSSEASGTSSHAEGAGTIAGSGTASTTSVTSAGYASHSEGYGTVASGSVSHSEGNGTTASGMGAHAEGNKTTASGKYSHAEGNYTTASGDYSHAGGYYTTSNAYAYTIGRRNASTAGPSSATSTTGSVFVIGKGTSASALSNAFRVDIAGAVYGSGAYNSTGADYAEYFEWLDGNEYAEDRRGYFVTLDGDKIRIATDKDDYILGVISSLPAMIGDANDDQWHGMYLTDVFGELLTKNVTLEDGTPDTEWIVNPSYDHTQKYIPRSERKEWGVVGMLGKLVVVDDGTCKVNGYCSPNEDGIGTASVSGYRVMSRIDDTHIRVLFR